MPRIASDRFILGLRRPLRHVAVIIDYVGYENPKNTRSPPPPEFPLARRALFGSLSETYRTCGRPGFLTAWTLVRRERVASSVLVVGSAMALCSVGGQVSTGLALAYSAR
jgi:hypothetical protein